MRSCVEEIKERMEKLPHPQDSETICFFPLAYVEEHTSLAHYSPYEQIPIEKHVPIAQAQAKFFSSTPGLIREMCWRCQP